MHLIGTVRKLLADFHTGLGLNNSIILVHENVYFSEVFLVFSLCLRNKMTKVMKMMMRGTLTPRSVCTLLYLLITIRTWFSVA